jgi:hypothetical protein
MNPAYHLQRMLAGFQSEQGRGDEEQSNAGDYFVFSHYTD